MWTSVVHPRTGVSSRTTARMEEFRERKDKARHYFLPYQRDVRAGRFDPAEQVIPRRRRQPQPLTRNPRVRYTM